MKSKSISKRREVSNFKDLLDQTIKLYGDRPAYKIKNKMNKKGEPLDLRTVTYNEFKEEIDSIGSALNYLGIEGERVAIISKDRYEWMVAYYATILGDKVVVPLDKSLPENELISLVQRSNVKAIFYEDSYNDVMNKIRDEKLSNITKFINFDLEEDKDGVLSFKGLIKIGSNLKKSNDKNYKKYINAPVDEEKMSIMLFTSGTTSASKAVMLCQKNICVDAMNILKYIYFDENDSMLALLPFHHTFQSTINHILVYIGGCMYFNDGLKYISQNLVEYSPTALVIVPAIAEALYKKIMKNIEKQNKTKLVRRMMKVCNVLEKLHINIKRKVFKDVHSALGGNIRVVVSGAAAMEKYLINDLNSFGLKVYQGYGLTETSPVLTVEGDKYRRAGSVGMPLECTDIKIVNKNELGIGEITAKSPTVMLGYFDNEEATKEAIKDGYFYTGDLGYMEKGYLYITGRKKNVIVQKNGKNIYPEELETLVNKIPGVKESMIYGNPTYDNDLDIAVKIVYNREELKNIILDLEDDEIEKYFKEQIAEINKNFPPYKYIRSIIFTDQEMIKTTTGKIKRFEEMKLIFSENK